MNFAALVGCFVLAFATHTPTGYLTTPSQSQACRIDRAGPGYFIAACPMPEGSSTETSCTPVYSYPVTPVYTCVPGVVYRPVCRDVGYP